MDPESAHFSPSSASTWSSPIIHHWSGSSSFHMLPTANPRRLPLTTESGPIPFLSTTLRTPNFLQVKAQILPIVHKTLHKMPLSPPHPHFLPLPPSFTLL